MAQRDLASINRGRLRHPLFGNRRYWYDQSVTPGFWDKAMEKGVKDVRVELLKALDEVAAKLAS
jgi:hypothetical protein